MKLPHSQLFASFNGMQDVLDELYGPGHNSFDITIFTAKEYK